MWSFVETKFNVLRVIHELFMMPGCAAETTVKTLKRPAYRVKGSCRNDTDGFCLFPWRAQSVQRCLIQLCGASAHHNVAAFSDGIPYNCVQCSDLHVQLMLHEPHVLAVRKVAHSLPPRDHGSAAFAIGQPVSLVHCWVTTAKFTNARALSLLRNRSPNSSQQLTK